MPLRPGKSRAIISQNIKEMVKAGHKPKQAIAASLAHARKTAHLAEGGEVEMEGSHEDLHDEAQGSVDSAGDAGEAGDAIYPEGMDAQGLSPNVMDAEALAEGLQARRMKANDNTNDYNPDDMISGQKMNKGGQIQSEHGQPLGNKPELDWMDDGDGEPMSVQAASKGSGGPLEHRPMMIEAGAVLPSGLSEEAKKAIAQKRAARKYGKYNPR